MLDTGDTRPPGHLHSFRPPRPVWVNLSLVYPIDAVKAAVPDGLDLTSVVPGMLDMWQATTTGHWVGYVRFMINPGHGGAHHEQWIMAEAMRPRGEQNPWSGGYMPA